MLWDSSTRGLLPTASSLTEGQVSARTPSRDWAQLAQNGAQDGALVFLNKGKPWAPSHCTEPARGAALTPHSPLRLSSAPWWPVAEPPALGARELTGEGRFCFQGNVCTSPDINGLFIIIPSPPRAC